MLRSHSHLAARVALVTFSIFLAGCETESSDINTAPPAGQTSSLELSPSAKVQGGTLGGPLANLTEDELERFNEGLDEFSELDGLDEGLGPVFNEAGCAVCHDAPVGGTTGRSETRFGSSAGGVFDPLANLGGSLIQDHAIGLVETDTSAFTYVAEEVPATANVVAQRITTPLFGLGLVDAVPDATLLQLAADQARKSPSTKGTPNMVLEIGTGLTRVGRFGWKAQVPTLHQFSGDAYLNEMGVTNPEFPAESCPQGDCAALAYNPFPTLNDDGENVAAFTDFMTLLGPPPQGPVTPASAGGNAVFAAVGCANCHTPMLHTGDSPVKALSHKTFEPFSDFLLHDMGSLGDGIVQGTSTANQMRTAPLWGLRSRPTFLHDGRATTPEAAILAHEGQGRASRDAFVALPAAKRQTLLAYLRTL